MRFFRLISILLFVNQGLSAQNNQLLAVDSLLTIIKTQKQDTLLAKNLNLISWNYIYQDAEKGIFYAKKALQLSEKLNWQTGMGEAFINLGIHEMPKGNYHESQKNLNNALKIFTRLNKPFYIAKTYNQIGILKANQSQYPESLDYFFKSLQLFEGIKNQDVRTNIGSCYENIGTIYNFTNSYDNAIENYTKAIQILSRVKKKEVQVAMNNASIGTIYQKKNELKKAIESYKTAEEKLTGLDDNFASAFVNSWMGSAYLLDGNFDLSIQKSNKALRYLALIRDKELISSTTQNLGYAEFKKGQSTRDNSLVESGFKKIESSVSLYKKLRNQEGLSKSYRYLSEYYAYKKSYEKALSNFKLYSVYNDSIYNSKNKQSLQNLQDQRTIDLRNKEIQLNKLAISSKEKQKWYLIGGILLLGIIGSLLFYQSRNRKRNNEKLQLLNDELDKANKAKTRFFSILNHDLRGPVANLINFLQLQKESPELLDDESKKRMQDKTMAGAENLLNSMEDILQWSKSQMENFKPQFKNVYISSLFDDIKNHFSSEENIKIHFEIPINIQVDTDENYLKTIIRNLTGNAIKALVKSENPTITWKAWEKGSQTFLSITDNGPGATNEQFRALYDDREVSGIKSGLGLHLIRDLAKAINCEIMVDSKLKAGTTIILTFRNK